MPHNRGEKSKILRGSFILANPIHREREREREREQTGTRLYTYLGIARHQRN